MEELQKKVEQLEDTVVDLQVTLTAHQMLLASILQHVAIKHGQSDRDAILNGIWDASEQNLINTKNSVDAESAQLLAEKLENLLSRISYNYKR